jgi:hypothetical protein
VAATSHRSQASPKKGRPPAADGAAIRRLKPLAEDVRRVRDQIVGVEFQHLRDARSRRELVCGRNTDEGAQGPPVAGGAGAGSRSAEVLDVYPAVLEGGALVLLQGALFANPGATLRDAR